MYGYSSFPASLDPHDQQFSLTGHMLRDVYEALVELGPDAKTLTPALATEWKNLDETTWEFTLRKNVQFHNGEPFNAEAVKFNIDRIRDASNKLLLNATLGLQLGEARVVAPDRIQIVTTNPEPELPRKLFGLLIMAPSAAETIKEKAVGTGPYQVVSYNSAQEVMTLEATTTSWRGVPAIKTVEVRRIAEASVRKAALQTGEIDLTSLNVEQVLELARDPQFKTASGLLGSTITLEFFPADTTGPLTDKRVRQAIQLGIDRQSIVDQLYHGEGQVTQCQLYDSRVFGFNPNLQAAPYDPAQARQLLAEAGYPNGFSLKMQFVPASNVIGKDVAEAVAGQLANLGIQVEMEGIDFTVHQQRRLNGGQADLALNVGEFSSTMDATPVLQFFHYTGKPPYHRFHNERFEEVWAAAQREFDLAKREQLLQEAAAVLCEEQPAAFLFQTRTQFIMQSRVEGFQHSPDLNPRFYNLRLAN